MAHTIQHNEPAQVNPETTKEHLLSLLGQISDKLTPEPAPLPDKISPATIYTSAILRTEWKAVCRDWDLILNRLEQQTYAQIQSVHEMLASMHHQTKITAMLLTIAKAGALPEGIDGGEAPQEGCA